MLKTLNIELLLLLIQVFCVEFYGLETPDDTLLTCYICMELEYAIQEKCEPDRPMFSSCTFTKNLLNWKHVEHIKESHVNFQCILLLFQSNFNWSSM